MDAVEWRREVPAAYEAQVLVAGGGLAGCCAAIAAARAGCDTLLIEKTGTLGGMATAGHVSPMSATRAIDGTSFGGIMREVEENLAALNLSMGACDGDPTANPALLRIVLLRMVVQSGARILFYASALDAETQADSISSVVLSTKSGLLAARARVFIDATGDADLVALCGEDFALGSEPGVFDELTATGLDEVHHDNDVERKYGGYAHSGALQPVSIMFTLAGAQPERARPFYNKKVTYADLGIDPEAFKKLPYFGAPGFEENGDYVPLPQGRILYFESARKGEVVVNMSRVIGVDPTDADSLSRAEIVAQEQIVNIADFLKRFVPGFENSYILGFGETLGIRESRRLVGMYVLRGREAIDCARFADDIACGSYIIDIHDPFGRQKAIGGAIRGNCYGIPYRCLVPKRIGNLLVAGRCISADHVAHSSTRIQGTCMLTGQAAGEAAVIAVEDELPRMADVPADKLRARLMRGGVNL